MPEPASRNGGAVMPPPPLPQQPQQPPVAPGMQRIGVKVPEGMRPGQEIQFPTPQGGRFKAVIPQGVTAGNVFLVEVPLPRETNAEIAACEKTLRVVEDLAKKSGCKV